MTLEQYMIVYHKRIVIQYVKTIGCNEDKVKKH